MKTNLRGKMCTILNTRIRKALYGIMLLILVLSLMGENTVAAAKAQGDSTQTKSLPISNQFGELNVDSTTTGGPPSPCTQANVIVQNSADADTTVKAYFCESAVPGVGQLGLQFNTQVVHVVEIRPGAGVSNLQTFGAVLWGEYYYDLGDQVTLQPGQEIVIQAQRFGTGFDEQVAALNNHLSVIGDLLLLHNTPQPNMSMAGALRWVITLIFTAGIVCADAP